MSEAATDTTQDETELTAGSALPGDDAPDTAAQSVVEAQLSAPEDFVAGGDDAPRLAEAAQQRQRFEALPDTISAPAGTAQVAVSAVDQAQLGEVETDDGPV